MACDCGNDVVHRRGAQPQNLGTLNWPTAVNIVTAIGYTLALNTVRVNNSVPKRDFLYILASELVNEIFFKRLKAS